MNLRNNPPLQDKLAAEYALGTLKGAARRRFETWLRNDAALRRAVDEWQDRLQPLAEFAPASQPSPRVWDAIATRLDLQRGQPQQSFWQRLLEDLGFWRGLGIASTALASILAVLLVIGQPEPLAPSPSYVAMLSDANAQPVIVITGSAERRELLVNIVPRDPVSPDRSLQLWAVPQQGAPRSLGLLAESGSVRLELPQDVTPESAPLLAVSLEPQGGSPNPNGPTGPILYSGRWLKI